MLQSPKYAVASMEDGLIDVIVMNLILKKAFEDTRREKARAARSSVNNVTSGEDFQCQQDERGWSFESERRN